MQKAKKNSVETKISSPHSHRLSYLVSMQACTDLLSFKICRIYPDGFGAKLNSLHDKVHAKPRLDLRQKVDICAYKTDLDIFQSMELGDPWCDAALPSLFIYLYQGERLSIPDSWEPTMESFYKDMQRLAARHYYLVDHSSMMFPALDITLLRSSLRNWWTSCIGRGLLPRPAGYIHTYMYSPPT